MSDVSVGSQTGDLSRDELFSGLFAQLVVQQANMAMMLLGKVPHPDTGKTIKDTEAAKLFIDQLEMLEAKTKGNLTKHESALLQQSLMSLRLSFVDEVNSADSQSTTALEAAADARKTESQPTSTTTAPKSDSSPAAEEEHRKKFSKKY